MPSITLILDAMSRGETQASEDLLSLVYEELRNLAAAQMRSESSGHTLQPTALVHEAWLRLVKNGDRTWQNRAHFFQAAAETMRRILIEHARRKAALKHGGGQQRVDIADLECATPAADEKILLVNEALKKMEKEHPLRARIVVMKFFGGMTNQEVADALGIGERSIYRHWECAKLWLFKTLSGEN